jgi:hypothetical protein
MSRDQIAKGAFFAVVIILAVVVALSWRLRPAPRPAPSLSWVLRPAPRATPSPEIQDKSGGPDLTALVTLIIKAIISVVALVFSFVLVLLRGSSEETRKWATGIIGIVIGFWLGSAS